ncbi:hypothetical protein SAMN06264364_101467 [Quadrisphaera granulorum]|uniref:Uncharacterized protein n=1 Tax=Quadrisphaera granulorum TaxID=317664 RepID=A0A316AGS9_9ACTN|nr:hypothetical protein [Quadrisphaera granulorum]PWJ56489.1 hypothetical protein BXY45_101467 [Quadrisphaera granulorum]SZE95123.1 hypothetical protein SAMN06264364_101467 [Quadrisphaera granulorum]
MTGPTPDPRFTASLRAALVNEVRTTTAARTPRRWRPAAVAGAGAVVVALTGGSIAVAEGLVPLPFRTGGSYDVALGSGVPTTHVGSLTVPVDDMPKGTNGVRFEVACLSPGTITYPDGAGLTCDAADASAGSRSLYTADLSSEKGPLAFDVTPGMRWTLELTWLRRSPTDWQTNARGETSGVTKPGGSSPDLVAAIATNGAQGYYRASEYAALTPQPRNPEEAARWGRLPSRTVTIPVYASDGTTVLGEFELTVHSPDGVAPAATNGETEPPRQGSASTS